MSKRSKFVIMSSFVAGLLLTACSSQTTTTGQPTSTSPSSLIQATSPAASAPSSSSVPTPAGDASAVFSQLASQVKTAKLIKTYNEDNDPNKLLGRPNGYTSKIAFADSRLAKEDIAGTAKDAIERGGSVEVFPDAELARGRADYIQGILKSGGLGSEYDYQSGPVLVRVTGNLSPSKAKEYQQALG